jgi:uncharacterized surface protein with fasciclin (FAS1) repeats
MTPRLIPTFAAMLTALSACGGSTPTPPPPALDLVGLLKTRPSLTRFAEALESTGVAGTLLASGSYTVFAPLDKAVTGPLDAATIRHHILPVRVTFSDMAGESTSYDTLNDDQIEIDVTEQIAVGTALMVESDISAANGIIHVIDRVQAPPPAPPLDLQPQDQGETTRQAPISPN